VVIGAETPLNVSQLNSIEAVFGTDSDREALVEDARRGDDLDEDKGRYVRVVEYEVPDRDGDGKDEGGKREKKEKKQRKEKKAEKAKKEKKEKKEPPMGDKRAAKQKRTRPRPRRQRTPVLKG